MAFLSPSAPELIVILIIALLVLGPSRLPETARSLGRGMRELRETLSGIGQDDDKDADDDSGERFEDAAIEPPPPARRDDPEGLPIDPAVVMAQPYDDDMPVVAEEQRSSDDEPASDQQKPPGYQNDAESNTPSASS
jgi:sec-independent protein translocase protein TatA